MLQRRIAWAVFTLAALIMYVFENGPATLAVLAACLLLPLASGLLLLAKRRGNVTASVSAPHELRRGEECTVTAGIECRSRLPLFGAEYSVEVRNLFTGETAVLRRTAAALRKQDESISLRCGHCGGLEIRITALREHDIFGLFARSYAVGAAAGALVRAEVSRVDVSLSDSADFMYDGGAYSAERPGYDPSETFQIREYVPGDSLRRIHWKLSGKTGKMLVRELGLPIVDDILLLAELSSAAEKPEEADGVLDVLFSLSAALEEQGVEHTIGWQDMPSAEYRCLAVRNPGDRDAAERELLGCALLPGSEPVSACFSRSPGRRAYAHIVIVSAHMPECSGLLYSGNRVTAVITGEAYARPGLSENWLHTFSLSPEAVKEGGVRLEV